MTRKSRRKRRRRLPNQDIRRVIRAQSISHAEAWRTGTLVDLYREFPKPVNRELFWHILRHRYGGW